MPDKEQFLDLAQRHMDAVFRLAFSCLKSRTDADDVTQTVLLRLYETDKTFESDEHAKYWLIRVTLNECKKHWRSPWRHTEDYAEYANTLTFEQPRYSEVFDAVMALDPKYRVVIYLYYYEGYKIEEMPGFCIFAAARWEPGWPAQRNGSNGFCRRRMNNETGYSGSIRPASRLRPDA